MSNPTIHSRASSVEFRAVSKRYGEVTAVDQVSLSVAAGELVTLLGPSGCGKTTTLRMIAGLEMASEGQVLIGDVDVSRLSATDRDVSMVFQSYALFPHMSVLENVSYGLGMSGMKRKEAAIKAEAGLELVGLAGYGKRLPSELSGGQQQRVAVARALVLEPQVLLFDEPLSNLDAKLRRQVRDEIRDIQTQLGLTVVYVTHDQEEALAVSDRIIVMKNAVVAQEGTPQELYETPNSLFVADFIGEANVIDVQVESVSDDVAQVQMHSMRLKLAARGNVAGTAKLAVRPNRLIVQAADAPNTLPATVQKSTYVGSHVEYRFDTPLGEMFAISHDLSSRHAVDENLSIGFAEHGPVLLPPES